MTANSEGDRSSTTVNHGKAGNTDDQNTVSHPSVDFDAESSPIVEPWAQSNSSRMSSSRLQWPPPKSCSTVFSDIKSFNSTTSLKSTPVTLPSKNRYDKVGENGHDTRSSPSKIRATMDCPVTPGIVERRLLELKWLCSSHKAELSMKNDREGPNGDNTDGNLFSQHKENDACPITGAPAESLTTTSLHSSKRAVVGTKLQSFKHKNKWPPVIDSREHLYLINERRSERWEDIHRTITSQCSGMIKNRRSFYEKSSNVQENGSLADSICLSSLNSSALGPSHGPAMKKVDSVRSSGVRDSDDSEYPNKENNNNNMEVLSTQYDLDNRNIAEIEFTTHERDDGDCLERDTKMCPGEPNTPVFADILLPSGQRLPPPKGRSKPRRTNYRIRYSGPTSLRLEDVYGNLMEIPEVDDRFTSESCCGMPLIKPVRRGGEARMTRIVVEEDERDRSLGDEELEEGDNLEKCIGATLSDNGPDVWITPVKSLDGARRWKVKRVWEVKSVDDREIEYVVDHSDLESSIRDLLGVPVDLGRNSQEGQVKMGENNPWDTAADKDVPLALHRNSTFSVTTVFDTEGQIDGSEPSMSMDETFFETKIQDIVKNTDHNDAVEELDYNYSDGSDLTKMTFGGPNDSMSPLPSPKAAWNPKTKSKHAMSTSFCSHGSEKESTFITSETEESNIATINRHDDEKPTYKFPAVWNAPLGGSAPVIACVKTGEMHHQTTSSSSSKIDRGVEMDENKLMDVSDPSISTHEPNSVNMIQDSVEIVDHNNVIEEVDNDCCSLTKMSFDRSNDLMSPESCPSPVAEDSWKPKTIPKQTMSKSSCSHRSEVESTSITSETEESRIDTTNRRHESKPSYKFPAVWTAPLAFSAPVTASVETQE